MTEPVFNSLESLILATGNSLRSYFYLIAGSSL